MNQKDYARRDSNPGRVDGNDTSYPWTTRVFPTVPLDPHLFYDLLSKCIAIKAFIIISSKVLLTVIPFLNVHK